MIEYGIHLENRIRLENGGAKNVQIISKVILKKQIIKQKIKLSKSQVRINDMMVCKMGLYNSVLHRHNYL